MKIKKVVLQKMDNARGHARLMLALNCSQSSIRVYIKDNDPNGELTKAVALAAIREDTGLEVSEILEEEKATA